MVVVLKYKNNIEVDEMLLPIRKRLCMNNDLNGKCKHNGKQCACSVYAGNDKLPNLFEKR